MSNDQELDEAHLMTISVNEKILPKILSEAEDFYDNGGYSVRATALSIARRAFAENENGVIDKVEAECMAFLAMSMLRESGAGDWDFKNSYRSEKNQAQRLRACAGVCAQDDD